MHLSGHIKRNQVNLSQEIEVTSNFIKIPKESPHIHSVYLKNDTLPPLFTQKLIHVLLLSSNLMSNSMNKWLFIKTFLFRIYEDVF